MTKVFLEDWKEGLLKVSLTKLQYEFLGMSLRESKDNVDNLLKGEVIEIQIEDPQIAESFVKQATEMGAVCRIEYDKKYLN